MRPLSLKTATSTSLPFPRWRLIPPRSTWKMCSTAACPSRSATATAAIPPIMVLSTTRAARSTSPSPISCWSWVTPGSSRTTPTALRTLRSSSWKRVPPSRCIRPLCTSPPAAPATRASRTSLCCPRAPTLPGPTARICPRTRPSCCCSATSGSLLIPSASP